MNQNNWHGIGRLAMNPQLKAYNRADGTEGFRCFFRMAITRSMDRGKDRNEQRASFIPIVAWGDAAKRHAQYLEKGTEVAVTGELVCEQERNEDGTMKRRADGSVIEHFSVIANDVQYGQRSLKNSSPEQLSARVLGIQQRLDELQTAGAASAPAAAMVSELPTPTLPVPTSEVLTPPFPTAEPAAPSA